MRLRQMALMVLVVGCSHPAPRTVGDDLASTNTQPQWGKGPHLLTYRGSGFEFAFPAEARSDSGTSLTGLKGVRIQGPAFAVKGNWPGSVDPVSRTGASYQLVVSVLPNPQHLSLARFTENRLRRYNANVTADGPLAPATMEDVQLAGQAARLITPDCGDCIASEIYFVRDNQVVVFAFASDDDDMLSTVTWPIYWLMAASFHWT